MQYGTKNFMSQEIQTVDLDDGRWIKRSTICFCRKFALMNHSRFVRDAGNVFCNSISSFHIDNRSNVRRQIGRIANSQLFHVSGQQFDDAGCDFLLQAK